MRASKLFGAGALLVSLSLFAAACGDDSDDDSSAATTSGGGAATTAASGSEGGVTCDGLAFSASSAR